MPLLPRHRGFFCLLLVAVGLAMSHASASYSSIYVFGDGVCTTTASPTTPNLYFGPQQGQKRWSNGPVWTEILSPVLGVTYSAANNNSMFGHTSAALKTNVSNLTAPVDAASSLFIVWTNNADFVTFAQDNALWQTSSNSTWTGLINTAINDMTTAINTLYNKGARKIVMPNAVDITAIPLYLQRSPTEKDFFRARIEAYNSQFQTATTNLMNANSGLVIYRPDVFGYFQQVIANPASYGFTNATHAATGSPLLETSFTGPGADYVFWDFWHPTTKFQNLLANFIQQSLPQPDTVPPVLTLPNPAPVVEASGPGGQVVNFTTSANDAVSGPVPTTAILPSGSTFPLGNSTVTVTATDAAGNTATGNFTVTVRDTTPPVITIPADKVVAASSPNGSTVFFTTSATDTVSGPRTTTATPPSGSTFPVGTTNVNVSASDAAGNQASRSFKVTVVNMNGLLRNVAIIPAGSGLPGISGLIQGGPPNGQVILQASSDLGKNDLWQDIDTIQLDASGSKSFGPISDPQGMGLNRNFYRIKLPLSP